MSTLNIKNFPEPLYRKLKRRAAKSRRSIAQEVIQMLDDATRPRPQSSLLELKGLGRDVWTRELGDRDAADHVSEERDSWT